MKQILVLSILFLFIGVAVAPSINVSVVKAIVENEFIEVTSEACGIKGYGNTTVKLTRQQYHDLEQYLVDFRARLNTTTTREEAVPLFKEAVVELDEYGLLPKGISVKQAQKLVTCSSHDSHFLILLKRFFSSHQPLNTKISNIVCLIAGQTDRTCFRGIPSNLLYELSWNVKARTLSILLFLISMYLDVWRSVTPFCCGNRVYLGYSTTDEMLMAYGWMATIGAQGFQKTQGGMTEMIGALPIKPYYYSYGPFPSWEFQPGVFGFSGVKISIITTPFSVLNDCFYLGSALWVKIDSEPPELS
ncbi:MAG: hypothetical protein JXA00_01815 [Candidatus Thermoplasmatota archaeon]|nr:hypothetical protein [Candidatus Thermoplasmatota archaeon]